jgi:alpha-beta hydrolase superfamily lysophospholipase
MPQTAEFTDAYGVAIVYDVHPAAGTPRGVVQLLHGVGEHAGRYGKLVASLTDAGFIVYADDHRGHGRTGIRQHGGPARLGRLGTGGLRAAKDAVWQLTGIIKDEHPDLPLVLLGHSWGSFLAQMLVNEHPEAWDAVVLSGSALRTIRDLNAAPLNAKWEGKDATGYEWLSRRRGSIVTSRCSSWWDATIRSAARAVCTSSRTSTGRGRASRMSRPSSIRMPVTRSSTSCSSRRSARTCSPGSTSTYRPADPAGR